MPDLDDYKSSTLLLALCHLGDVSPRLLSVLLRRFQSLNGIMNANRDELSEIETLTEPMIDHIVTVADRVDEADAICAGLIDRGIKIVGMLDDEYPRRFDELNDPPPLLFLRGKMPELSQKIIALVGAEQASNEGMELSSKLAKYFTSNDVQIVSTLVGGIDASVHLAVKAAGRGSFAVIEQSFNESLEKDFVALAIDTTAAGGVMSEQFPALDSPILADSSESRMQASNRIVVGLAQAVVVTVCYSNSERTIDLLEFCNEIGKLTFLFTDKNYEGLFDEVALARALGNGAILIEGLDKADDIIKALV